ncbi:MAG: histidine kinase [Bacteroidia bacterium]|nr:histidine kinase [Bacteroidia bacterium]
MKYFNLFVFSNVPWIRFLRHFLFWAADIANYLLVVSVNTEINATEVYKIIFKIPLIIAATYFILYYLIPRLSSEAKPQRFHFLDFNGASVCRSGRALLQVLHPRSHHRPQSAVAGKCVGLPAHPSEILQGMVVISMAVAIKLIKNKTELQEKNKQLNEEKKLAELNFLKAQMHPHFLFNTLNTLYSDAIQTGSKSEQIVLHLSSLLRFMLEECSKPLIPIGQEIKLIEDYAALERLRHGARLDIRFWYDVDDKTKLVSPLLLLPFIENSCKHTLAHMRGDIHIRAHITSMDDSVELRVENDVTQTVTNGSGPGLGISNVRKQLELLYNDNFILDIKNGGSRFNVYLKFPITKSV